MGSFLQDVVYGIRQLRRTPGLTATAVLALAIGIGTTTAVFSVANFLVLRPMAAASPSALARVYTQRGGITAYPDFAAYHERSRSFASLAAFQILPVGLRDQGAAETVWAEMVSGDYFATLGIPARLGRTFGPSEAASPGGAPIAVLSHRFWTTRFGADPGVVGRTVSVNGAAMTIVGVMPPSFTGASQPVVSSLWLPITMDPVLRPGSTLLTDRAHGTVHIVGRLAPGVSHAQAQADLATIAASLALEFPDPDRVRSATVQPAHTLPPYARTPVAAFMGFLLVMCLLAVVVACTNVATLLLARSAARRREMAVRMAIGAGRGRLLRQLLTEGTVLAAAAGAVGLGLALAAGRLLATVSIDVPMPITLDISPDWRVLAFTLAVSVGSTLVFALAPAWQAVKADVLPGLRSGSGDGRATSRARGLFMTLQLAVSLTLLLVAGLCIQSLRETTGGGLGMDREHVLAVALDAGARGDTPDRTRQVRGAILDELSRTPGVESAAFADLVPLTLASNADVFATGEAGPVDPRRDPTDLNLVSPGYLRTLGIPLRAGRDLAPGDGPGAPLVAVINERLARQLFDGRPAVGERLRRGREGTGYEIVGVAADSTYVSVGETPRPFVYLALAQHDTGAPTLLVRGTAAPATLAPAVRRAVAAVDAGLPVSSARPLTEVTAAALLPARAAGILLSVCGGLALLLAAIGIYGTASYLVRQRTREIGIRIALGARPADIVRVVGQQTLRWTLIGSTLGLAGGLAASRGVAAVLSGVRSSDPVVFVLMPLMLATIALVATLGPARRAARIDPLTALKDD